MYHISQNIAAFIQYKTVDSKTFKFTHMIDYRYGISRDSVITWAVKNISKLISRLTAWESTTQTKLAEATFIIDKELTNTHLLATLEITDKRQAS